MRYVLAAVIVLACSTAWGRDVTPQGAARTVTALIAIKSTCGKLMTIDQDKASKLAVNVIKEGERQYGERAFDLAYAKDLERRRAEVDTTGPQQWCNYQRGYLQSIGLTGIFLD